MTALFQLKHLPAWARWGLALAWTAFLLYYLTRQPGTPAVEVVAPVAAPGWQRELTFTIGHILGFGLLFVLWYGVIILYAHSWAPLAGAALTLMIGLLAESLQSRLPNRSASLFDVLMNGVGIAAAYLLMRWVMARQQHSRYPQQDL